MLRTSFKNNHPFGAYTRVVINPPHNYITTKMLQDPYSRSGIRRVINAATCLTRLGGSVADPRVYRAMEEASKSFVQIPELQQWAGEVIADATGAEAGLPTAGASNALTLAAAALLAPNPLHILFLISLAYFLQIYV